MLIRSRTPLRRNARRGFTLVEMLLVLVLVCLVLGVVSMVGLRLQRQLGDSLTHLEVDERLSVIAAMLPLDLRSLSPGDYDIRAGEARDTSLELRGTIASAVSCGGTAGALVVAPFFLAEGRRALPSIQTGDTLWLLSDADSAESWRAAQIRSVGPATGNCPAVSGQDSRSVIDVDHLLGVDLRDSTLVPPGTVIRITRPFRYSIYRAGDGLWYLGLRTWSSAAAQFNVIQPLSGPYTAPGIHGTHFDYFDQASRVIASASLDTRGIARIEVVVRTALSRDTAVADSTRLVVAVRNRR